MNNFSYITDVCIKEINDNYTKNDFNAENLSLLILVFFSLPCSAVNLHISIS